jgi:hypothetical protein
MRDGKALDKLAKRIARDASRQVDGAVREIVEAALKDSARESGRRACTVERISGHYLIRTPHGEQVIVDGGLGILRLLLLIANAGTNVSLANVSLVARKLAPFIVVGSSSRKGTGMDRDGSGSLSYKIPHVRNPAYVRALGEKILENRCSQDDARKHSDDAELAELQAEEDMLLDALRREESGMEDLVEAPGDEDADSTDADSTGKAIHALHMSVVRAIEALRKDAPRLAAHLKERVKANGTIRYEKTNGWDWEFLFPLERVNLVAGEPRDINEDDPE